MRLVLYNYVLVKLHTILQICRIFIFIHCISDQAHLTLDMRFKQATNEATIGNVLNSKPSYYINLAFKYLKQNKVPCLKIYKFVSKKSMKFIVIQQETAVICFKNYINNIVKACVLVSKVQAYLMLYQQMLNVQKTLIVLKIN